MGSFPSLLTKAATSRVSASPPKATAYFQNLFGREGPQGDIGLAYSITSSAVARSEGERVTLFQKRVSFNVPRDGWWVSDAWGALDGRIPPGLRVVPTSHSLD